MTVTQRRTKLKAGLIIAAAVIFLITLLAVSLSLGRGGMAQAETFGERDSYVLVGAGSASGFISLSDSQRESYKPSDSIIDSSDDLLYVFFSSKAKGNYTLGANFHILDATWATSAPVLNCTLDGAGYEIWNGASVTSAASGTDYIGGLASENKGTVKNLYYYFSGGLYGKKVASASYLAVGGMFAVNKGNITNCKINVGGTIKTEGDKEGVTSYVGGLIGYYESGTTTDCNIISNGSVSAYNDEQSNESSMKNTVFAGGVIGKTVGGNITKSKIKAASTVVSADNSELSTSYIDAALELLQQVGSWLGITDKPDPGNNGAQYIHPAGVVVGSIGKSGQLTYNEVEASGSALSYGTGGACYTGSISGGLVGELSSDCSSSAKIQSNAVKLKCSLSAFMVASTDTTTMLKDGLLSAFGNSGSKTVYLGAVIGRSDASTITITNNYFAIEKDNGIIEDGADFESEDYSCQVGLYCGNEDGINNLGDNNWMSRKLSECDTGRVAGNSAHSNSKLHHLIIFGDGEVKISGGAITSLAEMTVEAKPICSPFYGWTDQLGSANPTFTKTKTQKLQKTMSKVQYAVFIDTEIESSGELTQLAKDINQIELYVYKNIGSSDSEKMHFDGAATPTLSWLKVSLMNDILVRDGVPVIEEFYGTFDGKNNTISFASGSKILHDFEKDPDVKDEYSTKEDADKDITDFSTYSTGLFGQIKEGAVVKDLNILFGGAIDVSSGLTYKGLEDVGDKLTAKRRYEADKETYNKTPEEGGDANSVFNHTYAMANFGFPAYDNYDDVYFYALTGDGYDANRAYNPGYMELVPYKVDIKVYTAYVGILAGENYGTITNVEVEATKSAFVIAAAETVYFGTICGVNQGTVESTRATLNGKVTLRARSLGVFGGLFGTLRGNVGALYNGLSAHVGGEVDIEKALNYHAVTVYMYEHAKFTDNKKSVTSGYELIATDTTDADDWEDALDEALDIFEVSGIMGTSSYRLYGNGSSVNDNTAVTEDIGTLIGRYETGAVTIANTAAVSGAKGTFNTKIYNTDSSASYVGSMIGALAADSSIPTFQNSWAVMSYEEYNKDLDTKRRAIASLDPTVATGVNLVYVQKTVAVAEVDINKSLPISFTLASQEGMTFSGWYDYTSGERQVISEGLVANVFTPQNQLKTNQVYVAELLNLQLFSEEELTVLAASTNEGRGYADVTFSLGTNISVSNFTPIGTIDKPFLGTLDGNGLTVTLNSCAATGSYVGLFGCVGATGEVKNITVIVGGDIGGNTTSYAGGLAAVNYGVIGQDTSTGKVVVKIEGKIKGRYVGGVVGLNHRMVKNAEVYFLYTDEYSYGQIEGDFSQNVPVYAGGAVGYNNYVNETTIAKNIIVYYDNTAESTEISSKKTDYAVGGVIGANGNGAAAYSLVSVFNYATIFGEDFAGSSGKTSKYRGLIIGRNLSKNNTDSLWALCLSRSKTSAVAYDPELGAPLSVYTGAEEDVSTSLAVLMNGEDNQSANILIKYGWGDVSVSINGAESVKGGQITFVASKLSRKDSKGNETVPEEKRVAFYDYIASFETGEKVPVANGNMGFAFSPTVGTAGGNGLVGKVYYAGFCNTTIASQADYNAVATNVANDYRLYVKYNVTNSFTIDETTTASIGSEDKPFIGLINGNANTVTMYSSASLHAFVGVLGAYDDEACVSTIKSLYLEVRSGSFIVESGEDKARGFLTDVNNGTIAGVNLTIHGYLKNAGGSAGVVTGVNNGKIESATVSIDYAKAFGVDGFGAIIAKNAGGIAGENNGEIGGNMPNSIDVSVLKSGSFRGVIYGSERAGGIAGYNRENGVIHSVIVTFSGMIVGGNAAVAVGENAGSIQSVLVTTLSGAFYAAAESFGMIAGVNVGLIGHDDVVTANYEKVIKAYVYESPRYGDALDVNLGETLIVALPATATPTVGGIVGVNRENGVVSAMIVELHVSLIAADKAGILAGENNGTLVSATVTSAENANVNAATAGGLVGLNVGTIDRVTAVLRGAVGSNAAGGNGIVEAEFAGGIVGKNTRSGESVSNTAVALYKDVYGQSAGLAAGDTTSNSAVNAWVQICNSSLTDVVGNPSVLSSGFNVFRVLNETLLNATLTEKTGRLTFGSAISGVKKWYTDISAWTSNSGFVSALTGKLKYDADGMEKDVTYYVCYDDLEILNRTDFNTLATKINSHSYYNNVLFRLGADIMVPSGSVLRPIGTEEYPFNGIFDGAFYYITLQTGAAISGPRYAGLFGYTAENSVIKNFVVTIEEGVSIGSVNSFVIGSLVGYNQSFIQNVFVNLSSKLTYNSQKEYVGALIGFQASAAPQTQNVWISVLNGKDPVVGNMTETSSYGVNHIGVLGNGMTEIQIQGTLPEIRNSYFAGGTPEIRVKYFVPTGEFGTASYKARCQAYFDAFSGWYRNIREENSLIKASTVTGLGDFSSNPDEKAVWLITEANAADQQITLSFIKLIIKNEEGFVQFAENIKNYGDQGAVFKLESDITVDFTSCLSVGTPERPFTGTFDGMGHVITVTGNLIKREYAGVFGYVGQRGLIKNLLIEVGENVKFGDNNALYSGVAVALLYGSIQSVVVRVYADTVVYTTQGRASSGGIVGRAGKLKDDGSVLYDYSIDNCWLIAMENATVTATMGREDGAAYDTFYAAHGVARKLQIVGSVDVPGEPFETNPFKKGPLWVSLSTEDGSILFNATSGGSEFYGFIDNATSDKEKIKPISDSSTNIYRWTVKVGDVYGDDIPTGEDMLCVFINKYIKTTEEFLKIAENVSLGRNYRGIIYELGADITISASDLEGGVYNPIGGEVKVSSGAGYESFIERDFIGGFYGNGHTITIEADVAVTARYAGLFGRVGAEARIKDFILIVNGEIGRDNQENTVRTIYAGGLAGYALGGEYNNIVVVVDKNATLFGSVGTGRAFGYLPKDLASDVAANCWAISYNSKANYELNESELSFNQGGDGINQGGFNSLMVIAAGVLTVNRDGASYYFTYSDPNAEVGSQVKVNPYWYDRYTDEALGEYWHKENDYVGSGWATTFKDSGFYPTGEETRLIYNVSFLKSEISTYADLQKYATNVNEGYDFYKLTFTLEADIVLEQDFVAIGTAQNGMNGTFDGKKHTITLPKNVTVEGAYAGIFGYVSANGEIVNLRILLQGTLGKNSYTQEQITSFGVENTLYAGAIAYNNGLLRNVIVVADGVVLRTLEGTSGLAIAYDATNLLDNVWALVDASSYVDYIGVCAVGDSRVNTMTVVGIGTVSAVFDASTYQVKFTTDGVVPVMGWYKSFEKNQQISKAMLSTGDLANGLNGYLLAPADYSGVHYEVAVITTTVTNVNELIAIAQDVNVGGYTFENITFNLGCDIALPDATTALGYLSIGTEQHHFKGTFSGKNGDSYHKLTISAGYVLDGVFGYNAGTITDLQVIVLGTIGKVSGDSDNVFGVVSAINKGTIRRVYVKVASGGVVTGKTVGGIVGSNLGTISDCLVVVEEGGLIEARTNRRNAINVGAVAGINYGTVEGASDFEYWSERGLLPTVETRIARNGEEAEANVFIFGTISAVSTAAAGSGAVTNAGGAVGNQNDGFLNYMIVYLADSGVISSVAPDADLARAGGFVGYSKAAMNHSAVFLYGTLLSEDYLGGTAGYLDGVIALNVWQITLNRVIDGAGEGAKTVNSLNIKGNGKVNARIDLFTKRIIFTNVTDVSGSKIDNWYTAPSVEVDDKTGNVGEKGNTFLPLGTIQNKNVTVIFVNTEIYSAADLNDMASSVSGGLSGNTLVFTLMNDITVDVGDLTALIGTAEYPFNNVFDGMGHKITLKGGSLYGADYYGLFGYTGATSIIRNLTVQAEAGVYGAETSERSAILVAYSEGTITGVTVIMDEGAELFGESVAVVATSSFGSIDNVTLTLSGRLIASAANTAIAGGLVGANEGTVENVTITTTATFEAFAGGVTAYVGVLAGENYKTIFSCDVTYSGTLTANGSMTGYSGVAVGVNLGNVYHVYVEIKNGGFGAGVSGGLIGNNVNALTASLVKIVGETFKGVDSAVGYAKAKDANKVHNVWVYSDKVANVSQTACINSMTYEVRVISCPTAAEVKQGKISFTSDAISDLLKNVAYFANVVNGSYVAGTGAAMDNVVYTTSPVKSVTYQTYDMEAEVAVSRKITDVRVCFVTRKSIGSGSELYAFALAVNSGVYAFEDAEFPLTQDITLPTRAFPSISLPSAVVFDGAHYVVTVGGAKLTDALFASNAGEIKNLGLRFTEVDSAVSLIANNTGTVTNAVVYLETGVTLASGDFFAATNSGTYDNLWLVVRNDTALAQGVLPYSILKINGVGTLRQSGGNVLTFTAVEGDGVIFIGYEKQGEIFSDNVLFNTAEKEKLIYTAHFISTTLTSDYELKVLSDVVALGYQGAGQTFVVTKDLNVTEPLFASGAFTGVIEGNGHVIKANGVKSDETETHLLGIFGGALQNLVLDVREGGKLKLFSSDRAVAMTNVVILEERAELSVGGAVTATGVWVVSENKDLYTAFLDGENAAYSLLYKNGAVSYAFNDGITVSADDDEDQVFAGWYGTLGAAQQGSVVKTKTLSLPKQYGNVYLLNYINRTLGDQDDLVRLSTAVKGGFDFENTTFRVADNGFTVTQKIDTIGDATHEFKGNIFGGNKSEIVYAKYGATATFEVAPFLHRLIGEVKEVVFVFKVGAAFSGKPTLINENVGRMQGVVVVSENAALFNGGAGLTLVNGGEIKNCWLLTRGEDNAVAAGNLEGVNVMRADATTVDVTFTENAQGTRVMFHLSPVTGSFLCLYGFDGKVVFPGNYSNGYYTAPATASGNKIVVRSINEIADQDEFVYLGYITATGNLQEGSVIKLKNDVEIKRNLKSIRFKGLILDLNGHYLNLLTSTSTGEVIFDADLNAATSSGTVQNGSIYLNKDAYGIGVNGLTLKDCALFLTSDGMTIPEYNVVGTVKIVTEDRTRKTELFAASGAYSYLYAPKASYVFETSPEADAAIRYSAAAKGFVGQENAFYYYGGIDNIGGTEDVAYFAAKTVKTAAQFVDLCKAVELSEDSLLGATVAIASDIEVDGTVATGLAFAGTILGDGHTVTVTGGTFTGAYLSLLSGGAASDVAFAFKEATINTAVKLVSVAGENAGRIVVVAYQSGEAAQAEDKAIVLNVYGQGSVDVTFGEKVVFTAKESGNYALKEWKNGEISKGREASISADNADAAYFALRYLVKIEYVGETEEVLKRNQSDLPTFKGDVGVLFDKTVGNNLTVEVDDIGKNFLFKGISSDDAAVSVGANAWTYDVTLAASYLVTLKVDLRYISMVWESAEYKADETSFTGYDTLKTELTGAGYEVQYEYEALDDAPPLVGLNPYHAGSYLVHFRVYKDTGVNRRMICNAEGGLIIKKAILTFDGVSIKDKIYDGTDVAEKDGDVSLSGFKGEDATYVSIDGLTFTFADKNAGQGKLVYVSGDGTLSYKAAVGAAEKYKYVYRNYDFDAGSITSSGEVVRANIRLRELVLSVESLTVEYLEQFELDAPTLTLNVVSGLVELDRAAFESTASSLITRENASCYDVGYYRIIVGNSFAFPNYEVKLTPGSEAYYIVTPSEVLVEFDDDDTMVYGEKNHNPKYHTYVGTVDTKKYRAMKEGDELYFTNVVYDGELLPSATKYSFTCLFSAENVNYTVKITGDNYRIVNGKALAVLSGENTLTVTPKPITITSDATRNTKRFGKRTESCFAELAAGVSFVENGARLVVSRAKGEAVGEYALHYAVKGANGEDLTSRYTFNTQSGAPYVFTITQVAVLVKPTKTQIIYGNTVEMIKYGVSVEGGGITLADLYYATHWTEASAPEKSDATLKDIGISLTLNESLKAVLNVGEYDASFDVTSTNANVSEVRFSGAQKMIIVQKRYLKLVINDVTRSYTGKSEINDAWFGYEIDSSTPILAKDRGKLVIKENGYRVAGQKASVGIYKIDGDFSLESKSGNVADNYYLTYVQGTLTINAVDVSVTAEIGYFDEQGKFIPATIERNGSNYSDIIYYGNSKATFNYTLDKNVPILGVPEDGTDKEISDYIADALKISHYRLNGLIPGYYEAVGKEDKGIYSCGMLSTNNNFNVTFTVSFDVEPVRLTVKLLPISKTIGQPDPEFKYELIAKDPVTDEVIEDYDEIAKGTFDIVINADRSIGESLGTYNFENFTIEVTNLAAGEALTDETSQTGEALGANLETKTSDATLKIEQKEFYKTTLGKVLIYGAPILVIAGLAVFLIIYIPRARKKKKSKGGDPTSPDDGAGANGEEELPAEEKTSSEDVSDEESTDEAASERSEEAADGADDDFDAADFDIGPRDEE